MSRNKVACCCQYCFEKSFVGFENNEPSMINHNLKRNSRSGLLITHNSNQNKGLYSVEHV